MQRKLDFPLLFRSADDLLELTIPCNLRWQSLTRIRSVRRNTPSVSFLDELRCDLGSYRICSCETTNKFLDFALVKVAGRKRKEGMDLRSSRVNPYSPYVSSISSALSGFRPPRAHKKHKRDSVGSQRCYPSFPQ